MLNPIKPHAPHVAVLPANSFVSVLRRTPQAADLIPRASTGHPRRISTPSQQRLRPGLPGYLIPFAPWVSFLTVRAVSRLDAFATGGPCRITTFHRSPASTSNLSGLKSSSVPGIRTVKLYDLPKNLLNRLRTL